MHFEEQHNKILGERKIEIKITAQTDELNSKRKPKFPKKKRRTPTSDKQTEGMDPGRIGNLLLSAAKEGLIRDYTQNHKSKRNGHHEVTHPLAKAALARVNASSASDL